MFMILQGSRFCTVGLAECVPVNFYNVHLAVSFVGWAVGFAVGEKGKLNLDFYIFIFCSYFHLFIAAEAQVDIAFLRWGLQSACR